MVLSRVFALAVSLLVGIVQAKKSKGGYALFVDAGSSGSRLQMYRYHRNGTVTEVVPKEEDEDSFAVEPGISDYAHEPEKAGPSLTPLLEAAKKYIDEEDYSSTRIWLKATAGARNIGHKSVDPLFEAISEFLSKPDSHPFDFQEAGVLSGEEEGVFEWISVNSMIGKIDDVAETHGIVELGGASVQIAFNPGKIIFDNKFSFYVHNKRRSIYAKSYMNMGMVAMTDRSMALAISKAEGTDVDFPCFFKDYSEDLEQDGKTYKVTGTGDPDACEKLLDEILGLDVECLWKKCALRGAYQSPVPEGKKFMAVSAFFYIANGLGLLDWNEAKNLTPGAIRDAAKKFCPMTQEEAEKESGAKWKYLKMYCLGGLYSHKVLNSLGFTDDFADLSFARKLQGTSVSWPLGAALYETDLMPNEIRKGRKCGGSGGKNKKGQKGKKTEAFESVDLGESSEVAKYQEISAGLGCVVVGLVAVLGVLHFKPRKQEQVLIQSE